MVEPDEEEREIRVSQRDPYREKICHSWKEAFAVLDKWGEWKGGRPPSPIYTQELKPD
jgi:hypothetical protein